MSTGYQECPNCKENTAYLGSLSPLRCIPCGYGLVTIDRWATPERSRLNAKILSTPMLWSEP